MTHAQGPVPAFREHLERTAALSAELAAARCLPSGRFAARAQDTVRVLAPLLSLWVPEILLVLRIHGAQRFNQVKAKLEPISGRVLTDKLRHLEAHGLVARHPDGDTHAYVLTEHGLHIATLLHPLLHYLQNAPEVIGPPDDTRT